MHRIRTCLDIALGCAEEVGEICRSGEETGEAASVAQEAARALRLVYHYTHELNDMAALNTLIREGTPSPVEGNLALGEAAEGLARPAADASVNLIFEPSSEPLAILAEPALLVRALRYLILMAVVSPGVTSVACSVRAIRTTDGDMVEFLINDDGRGTTLEKRASLTPGADGLFSGAEGKPAADAAGFAIARRLAKAFGGHVSLEVAPGRGSKVALVAPRFVGAA
jgi:signal transduction histidine kinase